MVLAVRAAVLSLCLALAGSQPPVAAAVRPVLWAWERAEDLRFAGAAADIAILAGTVTLAPDAVLARPRRQPALVLPSQRLIGVVHVEIDRGRPLVWTPGQRDRATAAILALLADPRFAEIQLDFEVRASERPILLDLLAGLRAGAPGRRLSMTALASWCDTERWIADAPVDEVVPMLFRMGPTGAPLLRRLASGGDLAAPRCRAALGIAADTPPARLPGARRVWMFNPRPWTAETFDALMRIPAA